MKVFITPYYPTGEFAEFGTTKWEVLDSRRNRIPMAESEAEALWNVGYVPVNPWSSDGDLTHCAEIPDAEGCASRTRNGG